ncbi:MAG: UvrB/UvrC motif-containing protein [Clostridiales bacterium]
MLCQKCQKRVASYLVTQIINNEEKKVYLCGECAYLGNSLNMNFSNIFDDLVSNVIGFDDNTARKYVENVEQQNICSKCGMNYKEFEKIGKFGCESCYESFQEMLIPIIKRLQKNTNHLGKYPSKLKEKLVFDKEKEKLKEKLKEAIEKEHYELAAEIRDMIREMEGGKLK